MAHKESRQMGRGRDLYGAHKDGRSFPVEAGLNPLDINGEIFIMALVIDISIRKQQEFELLELNTKLEKKVENRTKELSITVEALKKVNNERDAEIEKRKEAQDKISDALKKEKELNELKTKFLSLVSHEFKTPLSGILTSAMLLGKYKLTEQQKKRDKHVKTISDKVHYLNNILNDFLSIEKLETGKINYKFSTFKLSKVVNEVVYNANMLLKEGQKINYPENIDDMSLYQDEKIVELALSNLVHNAIKYSSENTLVDIKVEQDDKNTILKIEDNGIGIPLEDQKRIFDRYFRAENALLSQGTGIGLNIVQSHLGNLGGTISFVSEENKGSIFTITIPNKAI
jgi:signal transduction histidine kinase